MESKNPLNIKLIVGFALMLLFFLMLISFKLSGRKSFMPVTDTVPTRIIVQPTITRYPTINLTPAPTMSLQQIQQQQTYDKEWGEQSNQIYGDYPWLDKLPLHNDRYFTYFDVNLKKFVVKIYNPNQEDTIKEEVITALKALGINTEQYPIDWKVQQ
jgi:hypothetical protein